MAYIPAVLSLLVLAAHALRFGEVGQVAAWLAVGGLLLSRQPWARRAAQGLLLAGMAFWTDVAADLVRLRLAMHMPWERLALIMAAVALVCGLAAWALEARKVRQRMADGPAWPADRPRPVRLLAPPEPVEAVAPVPDDPPVLFRWRGTVHRVRRADGPERLEAEWWRSAGEPRDYYRVEDTDGRRFWLFRQGLYQPGVKAAWFLHGFFG
mgnify:CR=1 FL=1